MTERAEQTQQELKNAICALLFVAGEPVAAKDLSEAIGASEEEIARGAKELQDELEAAKGALRVLSAPEGWQLVASPAEAAHVDAFMKRGIRESLSPAVSEVMAIVAYKGPISRAGIEAIRGVNSVFALRVLALRGLVDRIDNPSDSRSYLYRVSADFMRELGITKLEELPDYGKIMGNETMDRLMQSEQDASGT